MALQATLSRPALTGIRETFPLMGGYVPVAVSFGLIAVQADFSPWEAIVISTLFYAGASQFLFVGMVAGGAPLWLVVIMTLLINVRHLVYAPNLAPWMTASRGWPWLIHGLTDQVFALSHQRLPQLPVDRRLGWFAGVSLFAWAGWVGGTAVGAFSGGWLMSRWPLLGEVLPFALPSLFIVLVAPRFTSPRWGLALSVSIGVALVSALAGLTNPGIPFAALCGALCFYLVKHAPGLSRGSHE